MKIGITSTDDNMKGNVDQRFGRCRYFLIVDTDSMEFTSISNESMMASGGAGIQAAQTIAKSGVNAMITGNIGPNAFDTLTAAGVKVITGANGPIKEIIDKYKNGDYTDSTSPNVGKHSGTSGGN